MGVGRRQGIGVAAAGPRGEALDALRALRRGVIVGRDDRCDQHQLLADPHISRVHMMLRSVDDRLYATDLASTGRTRLVTATGPQSIKIAELRGPAPTRLTLARGRAIVDWQPVTTPPTH